MHDSDEAVLKLWITASRALMKEYGAKRMKQAVRQLFGARGRGRPTGAPYAEIDFVLLSFAQHLKAYGHFPDKPRIRKPVRLMTAHEAVRRTVKRFWDEWPQCRPKDRHGAPTSPASLVRRLERRLEHFAGLKYAFDVVNRPAAKYVSNRDEVRRMADKIIKERANGKSIEGIERFPFSPKK